jgi:hypothetical protein
MKKHLVRTLPPRTTAIGRADLLCLLHSLGESELVDAAELLGFRWMPTLPEHATPPKPPREPEKQTPAKPEAVRRQPLQATHFAVKEFQSFPDAPERREDATEGSVFDDVSGSGQVSPQRIPLSPSRRLAVFLRQKLRPARAGKALDLGRLLTHLSRVSLPRHLPRCREHRWSEDAALLIDLSLAAFPLKDDLIDLAEQAHTLSGGRLTILAYEPSSGWLERKAGSKPEWMPATALRLTAARHWLLAGDMGSLSTAAANRRNWKRRLRSHLAAGGQVTLLAGTGPAEWTSQLPRQAPVALWDYGRRLISARPGRGAPGAVCDAVDTGVARLLAALSLAVRVEPALLRQIRLELGLSMACELAAWNHADVAHCTLGMQIRPDRLEHYRAQLRELLSVRDDRQRIAYTIRDHHIGVSQLIRMEEAALAADLADVEEHGADALWSRAVRTLKQKPAGAAARELASYLGRTGRRAHADLWQTVPELAEAYVIARRDELRAGGEVPAGIPVRTLNQCIPNQEPRLLWIVLTGPYLVARTQPPLAGQFTLFESPPTDGFELESPARPRHWRVVERNSRRLDDLVPGAGPWTIQTPWVKAVIAEIPRPSWAIEWGRDREGLYAVAPSPIGAPVRLRWLIVEPRPGYAEGTIREQITPGRGFQARPGYPAPGVALGVDLEFGLHLDLTIGDQVQRFRYIEPGEFTMGSPDTEAGRYDNEGPQHVVRLTEGYWLADTACSQALWQAVMGGNPSRFKDDPQNPVEQVSWDDVQDFLRKVGELLPGVSAALPTEAEWEYACRAGTQEAFSFGESITPAQANYDGSQAYAEGAKGEYGGETVPVKSFKANPWGLYQMHGNVFEWCADGRRTYDGALQTDPRGPEGDAPRALRGGSWGVEPGGLRSAFRGDGVRDGRDSFVGFRFSLRSTSPEGGAERLPEAQVAPEGAPGKSPAPGRGRSEGGSKGSSARRDAGPTSLFEKAKQLIGFGKSSKPTKK